MSILEALRAANVEELVQQKGDMQQTVRDLERDIKALGLAIEAARQSQLGTDATQRYDLSVFGSMFSPIAVADAEQFVVSEEPPKSDPEPVPPVEQPPVVETPEVKAEPAPVATEAVRELRPTPIPIVPKRTVKPVAPCGKKIEDHPPVTLTMVEKAKIYIEANGPSSTMSMVTCFSLPDGKTLMRALEADPRFEKDSRGFWSLAK